jgi:hypothetical protein
MTKLSEKVDVSYRTAVWVRVILDWKGATSAVTFGTHIL